MEVSSNISTPEYNLDNYYNVLNNYDYYGNETYENHSNTINISAICKQIFMSYKDIDPTTLMIQKYGPYCVGIFCAIAFLLGFIGNGTLLTIILREDEMHQAPNIYLFSIALGDFLFILVYTPFTIFIYGLKDWPFNEATCKFITFLQTFSVGLSVFTLTVLTCDRYIEVSKPLNIKSYTPSLRRNIAIASGAWVAAIGFATLDLLAAKLLPMHPYNCSDLVYCGTDWGQSYEKFRTILDFTVFCSIPALVMLVLYILMARTWLKDIQHISKEYSPPLEDQRCNGYGEHHHHRNNNNKKKKNKSRQSQEVDNQKLSVIISVSLAVLFLLCLLPRQVFVFWFFFDEDGVFNNFWYVFKIFGFMTTFVNSCINPIALCIVSEEYRGYYARYFCCRAEIKPKHHQLASDCI